MGQSQSTETRRLHRRRSLNDAGMRETPSSTGTGDSSSRGSSRRNFFRTQSQPSIHQNEDSSKRDDDEDDSVHELDQDRHRSPRRGLLRGVVRGMSGSSTQSSEERRWGRRRSSRSGVAAEEEPPTLVSAVNEPHPQRISSPPRHVVSDDENPSTPTSLISPPPTVPPELRVNSYTTAATSSDEDDDMLVAHSHDDVSYESPRAMLYYRRSSTCSAGSVVSDIDEDEHQYYENTNNNNNATNNNQDFYPQASREFEWMGRSMESLLLGHLSTAPILHLVDSDSDFASDGESDYFFRRRSTASTFGGGRRRNSQGSMYGGRRGSLSLHGGTLASYYTRRRPNDVDRERLRTSHGPAFRRGSMVSNLASAESSSAGTSMDTSQRGGAGPNVLFSIMARESTGKSCFPRGLPASQCLRQMGGTTLYAALDKPAAGIVTEVAFLAAAIDTGDWAETRTIVSRLVVRLVGDPSAMADRPAIQDPNLPPTAPKFYAGGGRLGLERDAFCRAGGVEVLIRMFREKSVVGQEMAASLDARDLSEEVVATRLAPCWNEALAALRELVYFIPSLVTDGALEDNGNFLPFIFTLLSHDSCFDGAAAVIEEILSFMSQTQQQTQNNNNDGEGVVSMSPTYQPTGRVSPATTFFLGNVPDLYSLWQGFNCRQLAHFCRILALLVFEPEDRQLLESPAVLKSLELLQLRRNRAARAGRDSTVDMNQSILLGDQVLMGRLLKLLTVMNYAPPLRRFLPYHVMAHFPFIADTLVMLGLGELENWSEIDRQDELARRLRVTDSDRQGGNDGVDEVLLSQLGTVADMLEGLSETLMDGNRQVSNQIGHIIHVISAAQQAGVIVGRDRQGRRRSRQSSAPVDQEPQSNEDNDAAFSLDDNPVDGAAIRGLASVAGILTDQILANRLYQNPDFDDDSPMARLVNGDEERPASRHLINTPEDAANSLQFNAMLLGPYQVEVLFVLCTLLGGRRKLDAQDQLNRIGIVPVLDDMFQRLPWYRRSSEQEGEEESQQDQENNPASQPNGIHGPGCECTPESALCVQYLRLLHNFCDRDCDNYAGRRLLLSDGEKRLIFSNDLSGVAEPGLLSKIVAAFIKESDESPYRFWLASCIESYLRGSSPMEQLFAARSGLLDHLVEDISSERLHCAGSLQTSFDLLGELGKGNSEVVRLLVTDLNEESFRKLMSVAAANLVDSNVFIRSLLLSLERYSARDGATPIYADSNAASSSSTGWLSLTGNQSRAYLTHSWWDIPSIGLFDETNGDAIDGNFENRPSDWFPTRELVALANPDSKSLGTTKLPTGLEESVGHFGWVFSPAGDALASNTYLPNTLERLGWFLDANQARLLRDLLGVVDLRNINHENICCLNTAVVICIFRNRRQQLGGLLDELRQLNDEEKESKRRARDAGKQDDVVDRAFIQAMRYLDLDHQRETPSYARRASIWNGGPQQIGDRMDVMRNFREVLWFWMEYYTHRGRDRLSLEFSSHIRFQEWNHVVSLLSADDGSSTALVRSPVRLPSSPYQRAARRAESPLRGD